MRLGCPMYGSRVVAKILTLTNTPLAQGSATSSG